MNFDNFGFCHFCKDSTWLKEQECKKERIATVIVSTESYQGECKTCGRQMQKSVINAVDDFIPEVKE